MKNLFALLLCSICGISLIAQIWQDKLIIENTNPSINDKFEAFENYRAKNPYTKGNGYKPYAREMDFILERVVDLRIY